MAKQIKFRWAKDDRDYTLEFTRDTVRRMERSGFVVGDIDRTPQTTITQLFTGAFLAHHSRTKDDQIKEMWESFTNKDKLIEKLAEMYNETLDTLMAEPEEGNEGNIDWETTW